MIPSSSAGPAQADARDAHPELAKVTGPLGAYFRTGYSLSGYSLSEREREIAVIIVNSKWHPIHPTGLPADKVESLLSGLPISFSDTREQVVYEMATCLAHARWVPKGLHDRAVEALGPEGVTDVNCLMGFYTSVSMTLAFYDVPAGATGYGALSNRATDNEALRHLSAACSDPCQPTGP
jgi:4-carboxymuconolactone decarboxylase